MEVYKPRKRDEAIARSLARENSRVAAVTAKAATEMQVMDDRILAEIQQWALHRESLERSYSTLQSQF